jgi:molecular chaperone Hsp33
MDQNNLHSFHLEQMPLSGRIVRLDSVVQDVLDKHKYPVVVNTVLAEMMALASVLSGSFKYTGKLTLQVKGTGGIIQTAVVEVTHEGDIRAYARYDQELAIIDIEGKPTLEQLFGSGLMIFNLDQGDRIEPYQGIVSLTGESLGKAIEHYWAQSEQFRGAIFLTSHIIGGVLQSGALVIHQLPGGTDDQ